MFIIYKWGFSGEDSPRCVFPNCIGFRKDGIEDHEFFIGLEV